MIHTEKADARPAIPIVPTITVRLCHGPIDGKGLVTRS